VSDCSVGKIAVQVGKKEGQVGIFVRQVGKIKLQVGIEKIWKRIKPYNARKIPLFHHLIGK